MSQQIIKCIHRFTFFLSQDSVLVILCSVTKYITPIGKAVDILISNRHYGGHLRFTPAEMTQSDNAPTFQGFRIYRTTYSNQAKWDKFISLLTEDAEERLAGLGGQSDQPQPLQLETVENPDTLKSASWKQVRAVHDTWVQDDLMRESNASEVNQYRERNVPDHDIQRIRIQNDPRRAMFILGDEASVNSVVDSDAANNRGARGMYYVVSVRSQLLGGQDWMPDEDEEDEEDDEESEQLRVEEEEAESSRKFKAWDLAAVWTIVKGGNWPERGIEVKDGIHFLVGW